MSKVILINGGPGTGKTTIATMLAKQMGITSVISTDAVREVVRSYVSKEQDPVLHTSAIIAYDLVEADDPYNVRGFLAQARSVKLGVEAVIRRYLKEERDLIIEGIHLVPGIIEVPESIDHIVITSPSIDDLRERMIEQGEDRSQYKIQNIDRAVSFQRYLENIDDSEAHKVVNENLEKCVEEIVELVA